MNEQSTVWKWLGISEEEFRQKSGKGKCVVCGRDVEITGANLCRWHKGAFHKWLRLQEEGEVK